MKFGQGNWNQAVVTRPTFMRQGEAHVGMELSFRQIGSLLRCPVVGVCMTGEEQRRIVRKSGMLASDATSFDIHEILVSLTDEDNALSRRVDALLRKKYEARAVSLRQLPLSEFMERWENAFAKGDFAVELWAAASRGGMPLALQRYIFGCVHMAMHHALELGLEQERQLRLFRQERAIASEKFRAVKMSLASSHKEQRVLQRELDALACRESLTRAENEQLKAGLSRRGETTMHQWEQECVELRQEVETLKVLIKDANARIVQTEKQHAAAVEEKDMQRRLSLQLQKEIGALLKPSATCADCAEECSRYDSCPRRILLVGGMTRMEPLYRQLVEGRGDEFEYHDGCPGGVNNLEKSLQRADLILCPVNCNSHGACLMVKNLCKKYKKDVQMMSNFSLSAVSRAIDVIAPART